MFFLETFTLSEEQAFIALLAANQLRAAPPSGEYLRLYESDAPVPVLSTNRKQDFTFWMSDTPQEQEDHRALYDAAPREGTLLIAGMGVCMSLKRILATRPSLKIIQVERSQDVIDLNLAHPENGRALRDPRTTVVCADIFEYVKNPDQRITAAWFDIWPDICSENLPQMEELETTLAASLTTPLIFVDSWAKIECFAY